MSQRVRALRGFNDVLPEDTVWWRGVLSRAQQVMDLYAYKEVRLPLMEATELFSRSVGAATDIVEKEMFTFQDREKTSMSLRPEGTAGCVRAGIDNGLLHNQQQRFWYAGPMFRHERPQAGRYRQFEQIGVEAYGVANAEIDVEVIALSARFLGDLGLREHVTLELNTLGSSGSREIYRDALVAYLTPFKDQLDDDSQRRLNSNPLRIFDSKVASTQAIVADAPQFDDYLDDESREHFVAVQAGLTALGIDFVLNSRLVRGLDYYSRTVFEWTTDKLGAQGTVCAGGRYDALVDQLGGGEVPAIGFASGLERIVLLLKALDLDVRIEQPPQAYLCTLGAVGVAGIQFIEQMRDGGVRCQSSGGTGKLKAQLKRADASGADYALILGEDEVAAQQVQVKALKTEQVAFQCDWAQAVEYLQQHGAEAN
ncbi:MAG: histidine--tRNA ligase [Oceanococcus sp.]